MDHFSRVNWCALNTIRLGRYFSMQMIIELEIEDANTYLKLG
jgi:hypothetical protein